MTVRRALALVLGGVLGGMLSGLFGVGGGIIMVPLLTLLAGMDQRRAAATSLIAIVPASIVGTITYGTAGHLDVAAGIAVAAGGSVGALIGARLLRTLSLGWLRWLFLVLLLAVAIRMALHTEGRASGIEYHWYTIAGLVLLGVVMGVSSGLFGIGGGAVVVPALVALFGASDLLAKGTSLLAMIPTSTTGTIANLRAHLASLADGLIVGIPAALASLAGSALAFLMPTALSTTLFLTLIIAAATQIAYSGLEKERHRPLDAGQTTASSER